MAARLGARHDGPLETVGLLVRQAFRKGNDMAVYERYYELTIPGSIQIVADSEEEAEEIFKRLETGEKAWYYLHNEVYRDMCDFIGNNERELMGDIVPIEGVEELNWDEDDTLDPNRYLQ